MKYNINCKLIDLDSGSMLLHYLTNTVKCDNKLIKNIIMLTRNINIKNKNNMSILDKMIKNNNVEITEILLKRKDIRINKQYIFMAIKHQDCKILKLLLNKNVNLVNVRTKNRIVPIIYALNENNINAFHLISSTGKVDLMRIKDKSILNIIFEYDKNLVISVIKNNYTNNIKNGYLDQEPNIFIKAIKRNCFDIARTLIEYGTDINIKNEYNKTVLHIAYKKRYIEITKMLLENGAKYKKLNKLLKLAYARNDYICGPLFLMYNKSDISFTPQGSEFYDQNFCKMMNDFIIIRGTLMMECIKTIKKYNLYNQQCKYKLNRDLRKYFQTGGLRYTFWLNESYDNNDKIYGCWIGEYTIGHVNFRGTRVWFRKPHTKSYSKYSTRDLMKQLRDGTSSFPEDDCNLRNDKLKYIINDLKNIPNKNSEKICRWVKNIDKLWELCDIDLENWIHRNRNNFENRVKGKYILIDMYPIETVYVMSQKDNTIKELEEVLKKFNEKNVTWEWI